MKYAYVTVLSTNNYYKGVIVLFESLKLTKPKYNNFVVIVNETIDKKIIEDFKSRGYIVIEKPKIQASPLVKNENFTYWVNTFDKLHIFGLVQYDKIVYLDSDMYIQNNIDELFSLPHMSGVIAGKGYIPEWDELGSGMIVVVPKLGVIEKMIQILEEHDFGKDIGDQDIINYYYDWKNKDLAISEKYNMFVCFVDYYINNLNYKKEEISILHFIGDIKPWMIEDAESYRNNCRENNNLYELYFFNKYRNLLEEVTTEIEYN